MRKGDEDRITIIINRVLAEYFRDTNFLCNFIKHILNPGIREFVIKDLSFKRSLSESKIYKGKILLNQRNVRCKQLEIK